MIQTVPHTCSCWNVWTSRTAELLISEQLFSFKSNFKNSQGLVGVVVGGFSEGNGSKEQAAAFTLLMGAMPPRSSPRFSCCSSPLGTELGTVPGYRQQQVNVLENKRQPSPFTCLSFLITEISSVQPYHGHRSIHRKISEVSVEEE